MAMETLSGALEREHHEIDAGIEAYAATRDPQTLATALTALRRHIYLEEEFLFPALREAGMVGPIYAMSAEHMDLWSTLDTMGEQLDDGDQEARNQTCRILLSEFARHTGKEDPIVFAHTDDVLAPEELAAVADLVENATLPPGWVCQAPSFE